MDREALHQEETVQETVVLEEMTERHRHRSEEEEREEPARTVPEATDRMETAPRPEAAVAVAVHLQAEEHRDPLDRLRLVKTEAMVVMEEDRTVQREDPEDPAVLAWMTGTEETAEPEALIRTLEDLTTEVMVVMVVDLDKTEAMVGTEEMEEMAGMAVFLVAEATAATDS